MWEQAEKQTDKHEQHLALEFVVLAQGSAVL